MDKKISVVVKKEFVDRYTGLKHKPGKKLSVTRERYREILRSGDYVEPEKAAEKENK